jgi:hypothetical protein|tara:strand:+ start:688 stop:816 length:129 start_codon:yes stop_codon:yes gene_type:complete
MASTADVALEEKNDDAKSFRSLSLREASSGHRTGPHTTAFAW